MTPNQLERLKAALSDRYRIERPIGSGGMATVYLAEDRKHRRKVAVKVLRPELGASLGAQRFLQEIEIAARLTHPNILPLHDSGEVDSFLYYVMPYVEGKSLRERLEEAGPLPLDEALGIAREVADALDYAHGQGIVHRDIKPENIMLEAGHAVVTDFGVARAITEARERQLTEPGLLVGTPLYMSPEQAEGEQLDGRSDIYALGCVLYEMLAGRAPFDGSAVEAILMGKLTDSMPGLPAVRVPRGIEQALKRALARYPSDRFATARTFADALTAPDAVTPTPFRPRAWHVAGVAVGIAGIATLIILGRSEPGELAGPTTVAILPFEADTLQGIDLASVLPSAFEAQLQSWPELYRVVNSKRVADVVSARSRDGLLGLEALLDVMQQAFGASLVARGRARITAPGELNIEFLLHDAGSHRVVERGSVGGRVDGLDSLVSFLTIDAFVRPKVDSVTGRKAALPKGGLEAVRTWYDGQTNFRHGAYERAIERFNEVIALDSTFALAHFKRMLAELLRTQPTKAFTGVRSALDAARTYRDSLDPTSAAVLEAYDVLVADGDIEGAHERFQAIVQQRSEAVDARFLTAYVQFNFAPLLGLERTRAKMAARQAYARDRRFAATLAILAWVEVLEESRARRLKPDYSQARRYIEEYLALDSTSTWAELARVSDSLLTLDPGVSLRIQQTLADRPPGVLEWLGLAVGDLHRPPPVQPIAQRAVNVLWEQVAATRRDRQVAFRMQMASQLGGGRDLSADSLMRQARLRDVPPDELDRWIVLTNVTRVATLAGDEEGAGAARRLLQQADSAEALWLAARWYRNRDPVRAATAAAALDRLIAAAPSASPLATSLRDDLRAHDSLAAGNREGAHRMWDRAMRHYSIEHVAFGLTGSLWPLRLEHARLDAESEDWEEVLRVSQAFEQMAGFVDQIAWSEVLPLRAKAFAALGYRDREEATRCALWEVLRWANGVRAALRDSLDGSTRGGASCQTRTR